MRVRDEEAKILIKGGPLAAVLGGSPCLIARSARSLRCSEVKLGTLLYKLVFLAV